MRGEYAYIRQIKRGYALLAMQTSRDAQRAAKSGGLIFQQDTPVDLG
jgi:hypothetical protein